MRGWSWVGAVALGLGRTTYAAACPAFLTACLPACGCALVVTLYPFSCPCLLQGGGMHGNAILSKFDFTELAVVPHRCVGGLPDCQLCMWCTVGCKRFAAEALCLCFSPVYIPQKSNTAATATIRFTSHERAAGASRGGAAAEAATCSAARCDARPAGGHSVSSRSSGRQQWIGHSPAAYWVCPSCPAAVECSHLHHMLPDDIDSEAAMCCHAIAAAPLLRMHLCEHAAPAATASTAASLAGSCCRPAEVDSEAIMVRVRGGSQQPKHGACQAAAGPHVVQHSSQHLCRRRGKTWIYGWGRACTGEAPQPGVAPGGGAPPSPPLPSVPARPLPCPATWCARLQHTTVSWQ